MRVLYITAAHDQHIMSSGDFKPAQSAGPPSYAVLQLGALSACILQQTLLLDV